MGKQYFWIYLLLVLAGCAARVEIPLPKDHPAYGFYQTANTFNVSHQSCTKLNGSLEIRPDKIGGGADKIGEGREYQKVRELAPGLFIVAKDQQQWVTVLFMEYGMAASIPKSCSWELEKFPLETNAAAPVAVARSSEQKI